MSEYQYYEFRAIDRPLDDKAQRALRRLSSRATITPTSLTNFYNYADFRGSPAALIEKYFDAYLHFTNWGARQLSFRLPRALFDDKAAAAFCDGNVVSLRVKGEHAIVDFVVEDEEAEPWEEEVAEPGEGEEYLGPLIGLREDLLAGDVRALYLGWLLCVEYGEIDQADHEPPVPPGLGALSPALQALVEFLRLDGHLVSAAAEASAPLHDPSARDAEAWVRALPAKDKDQALARVVTREPNAVAALLRRFARDRVRAAAGKRTPAAKRRTVAELLAAAEARRRPRRRSTRKKR